VSVNSSLYNFVEQLCTAEMHVSRRSLPIRSLQWTSDKLLVSAMQCHVTWVATRRPSA